MNVEKAIAELFTCGEGNKEEIHAEVAKLLRKQEGELKGFKSFVNQMVEDIFEGLGIDGDGVQQELEERGYLEAVEATEENKHIWENIEFVELGETFYIKTKYLKDE